MSIKLITALCVATMTVGCTVVVNPRWPSRTDDLTIELTWNNQAVDLDLYLTYPDPDVSSVSSGSVPVYTTIQNAYRPTFTEGNWGFFPEDGLSHRERVHRGVPLSSDGNAAFERPSSRVQVISVRDFPFDYGTLRSGDFETRSTAINALPSGPEYAWVGVMQIYVYGRTGQVSDAGSPTVTFYDSQNRTVAAFTITAETSIKGLSVARIPVFRTSDGRNYYQFLMDQRMILTTADIRSIAPGDDTSVVFGVTGIERDRSR